MSKSKHLTTISVTKVGDHEFPTPEQLRIISDEFHSAERFVFMEYAKLIDAAKSGRYSISLKPPREILDRVTELFKEVGFSVSADNVKGLCVRFCA